MKKTNVLISLVASLFISTMASAAAPKTALVKVEPVQLTYTDGVKEAITNSLSNLKLTTDYSQPIQFQTITFKKQKTSQNITVKIASNEVIAD